jgi:hypothetical protein
MSLSDLQPLLDLLGKLVAAPEFYSSDERLKANAFVYICAFSGAIIGFKNRATTRNSTVVVALAAAGIAFGIYAYVASSGGMAVFQTALRALVGFGLGCGVGSIALAGR